MYCKEYPRMKALMMAATAAAALSLPVLAHADQPAAGTTTFNGYIGYVGLPAGNAQEKVTANCSFTMYGSPTIYGV